MAAVAVLVTRPLEARAAPFLLTHHTVGTEIELGTFAEAAIGARVSRRWRAGDCY